MTEVADLPSLSRLRPSPTFGRYIPYFLERVAAPDNNGCMNWMGHRNRSGYGRLAITPKGFGSMAHRFAYSYWVGEIPEGLVIDHLCRNRACVTPSHLEPVTQNENAHRRPRPTHCPRGHEYTPENTYVSRPSGTRLRLAWQCVTCKKGAA